jgi:sulfur transfer protein SufE
VLSDAEVTSGFLAALRETYPDQTMRTIIPKSVRASEATAP